VEEPSSFLTEFPLYFIDELAPRSSMGREREFTPLESDSQRPRSHQAEEALRAFAQIAHDSCAIDVPTMRATSGLSFPL